MDLLERGLMRLNRAVLIALLAAMAVIIFANVVLRYSTSASIEWAEEVARYLMIWLTFLGADPSARCVLHTHATHLVALTLAGVWTPEAIVPPITPYCVMKVGRVPLAPYRRPGDPATAEWVHGTLAASVAAGRPLRGVMLDRLGPVVWHRSPAEAAAVLEELEETARLWLMTGRQVAPLTPDQIDDLQQAFGAHW